MILASLNEGRDGTLIVVSPDHERYLRVGGTAATLQDALDNWALVEPALRGMAARLEADDVGLPLAITELAAPIPRAWQWLDGSAYPSHGALMDQVLGITPEKSRKPLMYQGMSDCFLAPTADVPLPSEAHGIDFEGEFGVITDAVPLGTSADEALSHVKLIVQINDWSLRALAGGEMKTGFGWIQAKPACSMAPFAVTPEVLGDDWRDGQVGLTLLVDRGQQRFGAAQGRAMEFDFGALIAHAAATRCLPAGTVIGSGTVSNEEYRTVGSSCIAERRGIEIIDTGAAQTPFLHFGERVRMRAVDAHGRAPFGAIDQRVVAANLLTGGRLG